MTEQTPRPIFQIADEIERTWTDVYFGAVPYLDAMRSLTSVNDAIGFDSAKSIVTYFLSNAKTWRGEDAARIKNELRRMTGQKEVKPKAPKAPAAKPAPATDDDKAQRKADAAIVKAAVVRNIFCPVTGDVLDMRRAVVVINSAGSKIMTATKWDEIKDTFFASVKRTLGEDALSSFRVLDGRELFTPAGRVR